MNIREEMELKRKASAVRADQAEQPVGPRPAEANVPHTSAGANLLELQRTVGNASVASLFREPEGAVKDRPAPAVPPGREPQMGDSTGVLGAAIPVFGELIGQFDQREKGLGQFETDARAAPKPSVELTILKIVALAALAAVTEGIGAVVAEALVAEAAEEGTKLAATFVKEALDNAVATALEEGVNASVEHVSKEVEEHGMNSLQAFLFMQSAGLEEAKIRAFKNFGLGDELNGVRERKQTIAILAAMTKKLDERRKAYKDLDEQYHATTIQWGVYQARQRLGTFT